MNKAALSTFIVATSMIFTSFAAKLDIYECSNDLDVTPGVWNTNFRTSLEYAETNHLPVVMWYGTIGCVHADKGLMMINSENVKEWFASHRPVMIFKRASNGTITKVSSATSAEKSVDPDLWYGRRWVKGGENLTAYPIMRIYWNKPDGTVVSVPFSGCNGKMPVKVPAGSSVEKMTQQLVASLDMYLGDYHGETYDIPECSGDECECEDCEDEPKDEPVVVPVIFGTKTLKYKSCLVSEDGGLEGIISVTVSKASGAGIVRTSGKITSISGKTISFGSQTTVKEHNVSRTVGGGYGKVDITFTDDGMYGSVGDLDVVSEVTIGGNLDSGYAVFKMSVDEVPDTDGNYDILHEALPTNELLKVSSNKMTADKAGSVKWSKKTGLVVSENNPSALKLTYSPSSGMFKGSFKVYESLPSVNRNGVVTGMKIKKVNTSVTGFVVDGIGIGNADIKNVGKVPVSIEATGATED